MQLYIKGNEERFLLDFKHRKDMTDVFTKVLLIPAQKTATEKGREKTLAVRNVFQLRR